MPHGNSRKNLITDKNTDYLLNYFINDEKLNEQLRPEWNEENDKNQEIYENYKPKLDGTVVTEKTNSVEVSDKNILSTNASSSDYSNKKSASNTNSDTGNTSDNNSTASSSSKKTPYRQKIVKTETTKYVQNAPILPLADKTIISERPLLGTRLVNNVEKYIETAEEKRIRAREVYSKLQDLVETHKVKLTRNFTLNDDPIEMEEELNMHKERRHKANQINFYKGVFINISSGIEFLNEKYDPFDFKLKDWSRQIATDIDSYTEVLEELYEKYKDKGGKMPPELKLIFMVVMSAVSYHITQTMFGSTGLTEAIKNNGGMLNNLMNGLMNNQNGTQNSQKASVPDNKDLLEKLNRMTKSNIKANVHEQVPQTNIDEIKRATDLKQQIESQRLEAQNEIFRAQMQQLQNERTSIQNERDNIQNERANIQNEKIKLDMQNKIQPGFVLEAQQPTLSKSLYLEKPVIQVPVVNNPYNQKPVQKPSIIFSNSSINVFDEDSDIVDHSSNKNIKNEYDHIMETLDSSSEDINEIIDTFSTPSKKKNNRIQIVSSAKKNNSTKKKRTDTKSDINAAPKKGIIRL